MAGQGIRYGTAKGQRTAHSAPGTGHFCISCRVLSRRCKCTTSRGVLEFGRALKAEDTLGSCSNENHPWMGNQDCCSEWKSDDSPRPGYTPSMFQARHPLDIPLHGIVLPHSAARCNANCWLTVGCHLPELPPPSPDPTIGPYFGRTKISEFQLSFPQPPRFL